jgi:hypothetical protein
LPERTVLHRRKVPARAQTGRSSVMTLLKLFVVKKRSEMVALVSGASDAADRACQRGED